MENSPLHRGGSDLPLYDPPPSYEDVIKMYLPPPPPYSSIGRGRIRNSRYQANGVENRAYRNDSPNTNSCINVHPRRGRGHHQSRQGMQDPMILKVPLPEEMEPGILSIRDICDRNNYEQCANSVPSEPPPSMQESRMHNHISPEHSKNNSDVCPQSGVINLTNSSLGEPVQSCECQGACSCKLMNNKHFTRCSSDGKILVNPKILDQGKMTATKKRSFKEMMHKNPNKTLPSAIIPHPESMTITVRPPKPKRVVKKGDSRSAGPSTPTSKTAPGLHSTGTNRRKPTLGHYRSSSGPSFLASTDFSLDSSVEKPDEPSSKPITESQILDASNLSQVRHLASVLFDGLQQSFNFRNDEPSSSNQAIAFDDDRIRPPVTWTSLLIPSRKRSSEQTETSIPKTRSWTACDTLPLLPSGSQPPAIVKFNDLNTSTSLDSEQSCEDASKNAN